jgi:hypothetical protein
VLVLIRQVFCMALNVGLIFKVKRFDGSKMPDYEKWYGLVAYGVPAMVPIVYLVHDQMSSHGIVGSAIVSQCTPLRDKC